MQCKQKYPVILNSSKKSFEARKIHNVYSYLQLLQENDQDTDHLIILAVVSVCYLSTNFANTFFIEINSLNENFS